MARNLGTLTADLVLKLGGFTKGMDQAARESDRAMRRIRASTDRVFGAFKSLRGIATGLFGGFSLAAIIHATTEAAQSFAKLEGAIRQNAGAAGKTAIELAGVASELQKTTTFSDETVQGMQALLLRFQSIQGVNFDRATASVLDLASALGTDLETTARIVGRALEDPIKGMTALSRAGVVFSAEQKKIIKDLINTGEAAKAQGVILDQLDKVVGGTAADLRNNFGGALQALKNQFSDLLEVKGGLPEATEQINKLSQALADPKTKAAVDTLTSALLQLGIGFAKASAGAISGIGTIEDLIDTARTLLTNRFDFLFNLQIGIDREHLEENIKALEGRLDEARRTTRLLIPTSLEKAEISGLEKQLAELRKLRVVIPVEFKSLAGTLGFPDPTKLVSPISEDNIKAIDQILEQTKSATEKYNEAVAQLKLLQKLAPDEITPTVFAERLRQLKEELNKPAKVAALTDVQREFNTARETVGNFIDRLEEQRATLGRGDDANLRYSVTVGEIAKALAKLGPAGVTAKEQILGLLDGLENDTAVKAIEDQIRALEEQAATLGLTEQEVLAYSLAHGELKKTLDRTGESQAVLTAKFEAATAQFEKATAIKSVQDLIKSIEDETHAFIGNQIAMEQGAVAALQYQIAHGNLKDVFDKTTDAGAALQKRLEDVTKAQEALTERAAAIGASEEVLPSRQEAAKEYIQVLEGLGIRLQEGKIEQEEYNQAVKQAEQNFKDATKVVTEWTVFMDEAARAAQSALADFLFDPFDEGLEGMVTGFADALQHIAAEIVAAKLAEKLFEPLLEGAGKFDLGKLFGFGAGAEDLLTPIAITAQRLPETAALPTGVAETTAAAAQLAAAGTTVGSGGLAVGTGAAALGTAAATLLTAAQAISAAAAQLAAAGAGSLAGGGRGLTSASGGNIDWLFESIFGMATGGKVPGSGSKDTVPAWLTPGEFVVRAQAVKHPGILHLLERINEAKGYATGGLVTEPYQTVRAAAVPYKAMAAQAAPMRAISKRSLLDEEDETIRRSLSERYAQTAETFAHTRNVLAALGEQTDLTSLTNLTNVTRDRTSTDVSSVSSIQDVLTSLNERERRLSDRDVKTSERSDKSKVETDSTKHRSQTIFDLSRWTSELSENVATARDVLNEQIQLTVQASSNIRSNIDTERNATHVDQARNTSLAENIRSVLSSLSERREVARDSYETTRNRLSTFDDVERSARSADDSLAVTRDVTDVTYKSQSVTDLLAQANEIRERVATSRAVLDEQERRAKVSDSFESTSNRLTTFDDQRHSSDVSTDEQNRSRLSSSREENIQDSLSRLTGRTYENLDLFRDTDQTERRSRSIFDLANITKDVQQRIATSRNVFDQATARSSSNTLDTVRQRSVSDELSTLHRRSDVGTHSIVDNVNDWTRSRMFLDESESIRSAKDSLREQVESVAISRQVANAITSENEVVSARNRLTSDTHINQSAYTDQVNQLRSSQREINESLRLNSLKDVVNSTSQTFKDTTHRHTDLSASENNRSLVENVRSASLVESYKTLVDAIDHRSSDSRDFRKVLTSHVGQMASTVSQSDLANYTSLTRHSDVQEIANRLRESTSVESLTEVLRSLSKTVKTRSETELVELVQALRQTFSGAVSGGSVPRFAGGGPTDVRPGGMLHGPGTPTSDDMLLWGSTKEFMVRAAAAQQPGAPAFLNAFNTGKIRMETVWAGMEALKVIPKLAMGGFVAPTIPQMAWGGGLVTPAMPNLKEAGVGNTYHMPITIQAPQGTVSQQTLLQTTAAVARGTKLADRRNN